MIGLLRLATVICLLATAALSLPAFAQQPGSTGGTIGKADKSVSGGQEETRSHQTGASDVGTTKSASDRGTITGRWHWMADCNTGHWEAEFALSDVNNGRFTGNFTGGSGDGTITDGSINGKSIAFTRHCCFMETQRWVGQLSGGHIHGSLRGSGTCTWEASKL